MRTPTRPRRTSASASTATSAAAPATTTSRSPCWPRPGSPDANDPGGTMTMTDARSSKAIGRPMLRKEDPALLTGEAKYTNDLNIPGALHLALVRSPYAHARITGVDVSKALEMPGVVAAYAGADLQSVWAAPMPCAWPVTADMKNPPHFPMAVGNANYEGDAVACVLATSEEAARDAVEAVDVSYEPLPAVIGLEDALSDRVVIHEDI